MSTLTPVTQRDVANACGVHPSTICLALKNSPSIPLATRRRIQAVAEELGYQPNVAARNLALLRTERKPGGTLPIAWLNQESERDHWRRDPVARAWHDGARRQAESLGYHLEEIWMRQPGMTVSRLIQIVRTRGIEGVLFPVDRQFDYALLSPAWGEFALVGLNDLRLGEWMDVFAPDFYHNVDLALRELRAAGFRRPGFLTTSAFEAASDGLAHSCFLRRQHELPPTQRVPVGVISAAAEARTVAVGTWLAEAAPDVVICADSQLGHDVLQTESSVPWVSIGGSSTKPAVDPNVAEVAAAAVESLVGKMRRFETGLRPACRLQFLKGNWRAGELISQPASRVA